MPIQFYMPFISPRLWTNIYVESRWICPMCHLLSYIFFNIPHCPTAGQKPLLSTSMVPSLTQRSPASPPAILFCLPRRRWRYTSISPCGCESHLSEWIRRVQPSPTSPWQSFSQHQLCLSSSAESFSKFYLSFLHPICCAPSFFGKPWSWTFDFWSNTMSLHRKLGILVL